jgi:ATP-dependent RNA helicase DeaD
MRRNLDISQLDTLVFDEADRMLSIGFYPDMKELQRYLPERDIHGLMFSATFPPMVVRLSEEFLRSPAFISLSEDHMHVAEVAHLFHQVPGMGKERVLAKLIETENPHSAIIFTNTKANCNFVAAVLSQFGYNADALSSDLTQAKREKVLDRVRAGKLRFLVATDVAARGIDIPELSHVFLYEPPEDRESYIHRSGRTGRAGAAGVVISLVDVIQKMELLRIGQFYKIPLEERPLPTDEEVRAVVAARTTALLEAELRAAPPALRARIDTLCGLAGELAAKPEGVGLLAMLLDEYYHAAVHDEPLPPAPEPKTESGAGAADGPWDETALRGALTRAMNAMKPLSRERMMKFYPLATELGADGSNDGEGRALLAMLLDRFACLAPAAPKRSETNAEVRSADGQEEEKPRRSRRSRSRRKPKEQAEQAPEASEGPEASEAPEARGDAAPETEAEGAAQAEPDITPDATPDTTPKAASDTAPNTEQNAAQDTPQEGEKTAKSKRSRSRRRKPKGARSGDPDAPRGEEKARDADTASQETDSQGAESQEAFSPAAEREQQEPLPAESARDQAPPTLRERLASLPALPDDRREELLPVARELAKACAEGDAESETALLLLLDRFESGRRRSRRSRGKSAERQEAWTEVERDPLDPEALFEPDDPPAKEDDDDVGARARRRRPRRKRRKA